MKLKSLFLAGAALLALSYSSCKKSEVTTDTVAETQQVSMDNSTSDVAMDDANDALNDAADENPSLGGVAKGGNNILPSAPLTSCATVTVSAGAFPKTVTIDFGTAGCTSPNGLVRKGKIIIVVSDSLRHNGATSVMNFDGYYVNGFKIEGTITWTNTSTGTIRSWKREVANGKTTSPEGRVWTHSGIKYITQIEGKGTPVIRADDAFSITGSNSITNARGITHTATIDSAVTRASICKWAQQGVVTFKGPNHAAVLNYGTYTKGTCDNDATVSIDGGAAKAIKLP